MEKEKKKFKKKKRSFDEGTHPGAYTDRYDINNELLDTVDSADDMFIPPWANIGVPANLASPPVADPPVPNRAHTGI